MTPLVAIIILNWNNWKDTIECLESVYQITYPNYEVIIVDNCSNDDSIQRIREYCEGRIIINSKFLKYNPNNKPIYILEYTREQARKGGNLRKEKYFSKIPSNRKLRLILNEKNYGFAEGNNIGIRYSLKVLNPDYILLLNNDTAVNKDFLTELVKVAESDKRIGITGPKIYYYDFNGRIDVINFAGGKMNMWKGLPYHIGACEVDKGQYNKIREVDYIEGSCILIRRSVLDKIGLIDPNYFAYWEENDLCMKASKAGFRIVYVPTAKIWHKISASTDNKIKAYYLNRNRFIFMKKYASKRQLATFLLYFFCYQFWVRCAMLTFYYKDLGTFIAFLRGVIDGITSRFNYYSRINI